MKNEFDLINRAKAGDDQAFAALVKPHLQVGYNVCLRITGSSHDAEDAIGEAMGLAYRNLSSFRMGASFGTWFYRIASNSAIEINRRRKPVLSLDWVPDAGGRTTDPSVDFEFETINGIGDIGLALQAISMEMREAFILSTLVGMKVSEIAKHQGTSISTAKVRVHRAKVHLRKNLNRDGSLRDKFS